MAAASTNGTTTAPLPSAPTASVSTAPITPAATPESSTTTPTVAPETPVTPPSTFRSTLAQWIAVMVKNFLLIATGSSNPDSLITSFEATAAPNSTTQGLLGWITYINILCVPLGGLLSGIFTHFIGRKRTLHLAIIPLLGFRIWSAFAEGTELCIALVMTSLCSEFFKAPVLSHVAESAQPQLRGTLATTSSTSMMLSSFLQLFMQTFFGARTISIINFLLPVVAFCLLLVVPESPHWLIMNDQFEDAKKSLAWLRGWVSVDDPIVQEEYQEMLTSCGKTDTPTPTVTANTTSTAPKKPCMQSFIEHVKLFTKPTFLWPLSIICFVYIIVHCTGTTTLLAKPDQIFTTLQAPISKQYLVVLMGAANSAGCSISVSMIAKFGKRPMAFMSVVGIGMCSLIIATYAFNYDIFYLTPPPNTSIVEIKTLADANMEPHKWIPVIMLFLLTIISHCGISNLPSMLVGELFPKESRSSGVGLSAGITSLIAAIVTKTYGPLVGLFTFPGMYWIYSGISFLGVIVLYFILPETEGKSLQEIEDHFAGVSKLDNKVGKKSKDKTGSTESLNPPSTFRSTIAQWLAVMVKNFLLIATGSSNPDSLITSFEATAAPNSTTEGILGWITYINILCVPLGGLLSGVFTHFIGRKRTLHLAIFPLLGFRIWSAFAEGWELCIALVMTSLCSEFFKAPVLSHVAESAQPHLRGTLATTSATSMMLSSFLQLFMKTFFSTRTISVVNFLLPVVAFCLLLVVPESPHWLIMNDQFEEAKKSLAWLRGWVSIDDPIVQEEYQEMLTSCGKTDTPTPNVTADTSSTVPKKPCMQSFIEHVKLFTKPTFFWPLSIICFVYIIVHCTGTTTLLAKPDQIFTTLQAPISKQYLVVLMGAANSAGCSISVSLIAKFGKRPMAFMSVVGIGLCSLIIATYAFNYDIFYLTPPPNASIVEIKSLADANMEPHKWIPVIMLFLLTIISHCGISNLPSMLVGEFFPKESRSSGVGLSSGITSLIGAIVTKTYGPLVGLVTFPGMYWIYSGISFLGVIVLYFILPETEGKSLQEIEDHFAGVSKLGNKVGKPKPKGQLNVNTAPQDQIIVTNPPASTAANNTNIAESKV